MHLPLATRKVPPQCLDVWDWVTNNRGRPLLVGLPKKCRGILPTQRCQA